VSSKKLLKIVESLLSHTHVPPSIDEDIFMARVNFICCLLKDNAPISVSKSEHNHSTDVVKPGSDDIDGVAPLIISRGRIHMMIYRKTSPTYN
jgi:hypothetical protein